MSQTLPEAGYSIAAVSKLTGVSCHALRVWERRYGFPVPVRSHSGHRRYSHDQIRILRRVLEGAHSGHAIRDMIADARDGRLGINDAPEETGPLGSRLAELVDSLLAGDLEGGEARFQRLAEQSSRTDLIHHVITPALVDAGERWFRRECEIYQERCLTRFLRGKLEALIAEARRANHNPTRTILIGTVQGDRHSGAVLLLNWQLENAGWRAVNLGVDLPVCEYQKAVTSWRPDALGLSFVLSRNIHKRFLELSQIRGVPIFVGGRSILNYQGLARRHGLIPVPGPMDKAVDRLSVTYEEWARGHRPSPTSSGGEARGISA